ncbi:bcl-2-like protein 11 [Vanacampus margaritifer]
MHRAHGTAVTTEASEGRPRPELSKRRREQQGSGFCRLDTEEGGELAAAGGGAPAAGAPRSPSRRRSSVSPLLSPERRGVFETRTIFHFPYRRSSSGYLSGEGDSLPGSPLSPHASASASTQTPSPAAQVLQHALVSVPEVARYGRRRLLRELSYARPSLAEIGHAVGDMQAVEIGQELRRIGDDYNDYILRGVAHRGPAARQNQLPVLHNHQEPAFLICAGVLLFMIVWYLGGDPNGQPDHPQGIGYFKEL